MVVELKDTRCSIKAQLQIYEQCEADLYRTCRIETYETVPENGEAAAQREMLTDMPSPHVSRRNLAPPPDTFQCYDMLIMIGSMKQARTHARVYRKR